MQKVIKDALRWLSDGQGGQMTGNLADLRKLQPQCDRESIEGVEALVARLGALAARAESVRPEKDVHDWDIWHHILPICSHTLKVSDRKQAPGRNPQRWHSIECGPAESPDIRVSWNTLGTLVVELTRNELDRRGINIDDLHPSEITKIYNPGMLDMRGIAPVAAVQEKGDVLTVATRLAAHSARTQALVNELIVELHASTA